MGVEGAPWLLFRLHPISLRVQAPGAQGGRASKRAHTVVPSTRKTDLSPGHLRLFTPLNKWTKRGSLCSLGCDPDSLGKLGCCYTTKAKGTHLGAGDSLRCLFLLTCSIIKLMETYSNCKNSRATEGSEAREKA